MMPNAQRPVLVSEDSRFDRYRRLLSETSLFGSSSRAALDDLAPRMQVRTRPAGTALIAQDEVGESMYILVSGHARVVLFGENGRELTLAELRPGDFFGELAILDERPRAASVIAVGDVALLELTRSAFNAHIERHPQTAVQLLKQMAARLRRADETIASLALHDVESRLVRTLERLALDDADGSTTPTAANSTVPSGALVVRRRPTQQALANMVGSCRETISRAYASMVRRGLIIPRGRALYLTPQLLGR